MGLDLPAGDDDFIIPGTTPDGHYTLEQQHNFIRDIKACGRVTAAREAKLAYLTKATPYSLRRGHISLRVLAGEDIKRIADDCGTSTAMIHRHYLHEFDMRDEQAGRFQLRWRRPSRASRHAPLARSQSPRGCAALRALVERGLPESHPGLH